MLSICQRPLANDQEALKAHAAAKGGQCLASVPASMREEVEMEQSEARRWEEEHTQEQWRYTCTLCLDFSTLHSTTACQHITGHHRVAQRDGDNPFRFLHWEEPWAQTWKSTRLSPRKEAAQQCSGYTWRRGSL